MKKYSSIDQFRNVVRAVKSQHDYKGKDENDKPIYFHDTPYPTLTFKGTVKLHGTNAGIVLYKDGHREYQSRERVLSLGQDNAGFMTYMSGVDTSDLFDGIKFNDYIAIYGEWCGGNIQKGVAISGLDKIFVIFGVKVDDVWFGDYTRSLAENRIYNINDFTTFHIDIDFNNPENSQNELIELTNKVEEECPVGLKFGNKGIGEGLVFTCVSNPELKFKSKGEKHSSSKVKVLNSIDTETLKCYHDFVDYACTENRMKQGLENVCSLDVKNTSEFIKWVANDILKEESDTIVSNNIEWKKVAGLIARKSSEFFRKQV